MLFQKLASTIDASQLRFVVPFSAGLSVLCRPLIPHMLLASVHRAVVNASKGPVNFEPLSRGQQLELKPHVIDRL
jgi:hypothetical protein